MSTTYRLNEPFIEILDQLSNIMLKHGEPFRSRAYQKAQEVIISYPTDITSSDMLKGKPNIGPTIIEKLDEYIKTGTLQLIEREKNNPVNIFTEVYGVGPKKAIELVENGIKTIPQLRQNQQLLNDIQKVGLLYYEDVLKRIPRIEIEKYKSIFDTVFNGISTPISRFEIVGSYRRGATNSGDIDVIITSDNSSVFIKFIDLLIKHKIILEVLSRGTTKCLVMARLSDTDTVRRVDFLYTNPEEFPFSILYFTGSKIFNTVMRQHAVQLGFTMNEHGLYHLIDNGKKKGEKVKQIFTSEKDIFDYLNIQYKHPQERIDGRAVIIQQDKQPKKKKFIIENDSEDDLDITNINIINNFKKQGISILSKLNEKQLSDIVCDANKAYYNNSPLMTDNEYDIIKEFIEKKYPNNQSIQQIGAPISKNKVLLPYPMGSMDKIKPDTNALNNWMSKYSGPYVLSCKLDGVSGLYSCEDSIPKLYTRGDGKVGQDISHLIPYLRLPNNKGIVIRGEFIIEKKVFETKYKTKFANPRNMVAGIINNKTINEIVKDIHFIAYEVIKPILKPSEQMEFLKNINVDMVFYKREISLTNILLSNNLIELRNNYSYEIDGIIVTDDKIYAHKIGNPEHSFAFKMILSDQIAEAKVLNVIWTPSKDGYLKPRVQIEPIQLGGVCIEYATGFNGSFIKDNKIGLGAIIEIIRSGDVIPHIRKVTIPAKEAMMPSVPYKWNDTNIDVLLENKEEDETVREKNITGFFRGIGVEGLSSGNITRIMKAGFDTVPKIIKMTIDDLLTVEGFKDKTATKLYDGIREKIELVNIVILMAASNIFGRGFSEKKLELIMISYPQVLLSKETNIQKIQKVSSIKGMAEKTAEAFIERIPDFISFIKEAGLIQKLVNTNIIQKEVDNSHPLFGKTIIITGFRDNLLQEQLINFGVKIGLSVSKNTSLVLTKNIEEDTGKINEAKKIGIPIMLVNDFKMKYNIN